MHRYQFEMPTTVLVGLNTVDELGRALKQRCRGRKVVLMCDPGPWVNAAIERIRASLAAEGFEVTATLSEFGTNPTLSECRRGAEKMRQAKPNVCVAMGGGSTLDAAKWIAKDADVPQLITLPTTAGTGSECNAWAVITDDETSIKNSYLCRAADLAVLDATLTVSMPPTVTLFSGIDAFSHGFEAYLSYTSSPLSDVLALEGCRQIVENLGRCVMHGDDLEARANMLEASMYTGIAMMNAGLGVLHCVANVVPGFYHQYPHGLVCGQLLRKTMDFNQEALSIHKHVKIFPLVQRAHEIFETYLAQFQLSGVSIEKDKLEAICNAAAANVNKATNPRRVTKRQIRDLITETMIVI